MLYLDVVLSIMYKHLFMRALTISLSIGNELQIIWKLKNFIFLHKNIKTFGFLLLKCKDSLNFFDFHDSKWQVLMIFTDQL